MPLDLEEGEKPIIIRRRHWFIIFSKVAMFSFSILIILITLFLLIRFFSYPALILTVISFFILYLMVIFNVLADYYLDIWMITNKRSIRVELKGFFSRTIKTIHHRRVQETKTNVKGIFPTVLDYGDIRIQTAGGQTEFIFKDIPEPYKVKNTLNSLIEEYHKK